MALAEAPAVHLSETPEELHELVLAIERQAEPIQRLAFAELFENDLYALLRYCCGRRDLVEVRNEETGKLERRTDEQIKWLFDRCREHQAEPDGYLDLWAREHYKSSIITFGGLIFRIIRDQNISIGIFSHTKPIAKAFLREIKVELEQNAEQYHYLWPHIFYQFPRKESVKWTENEGITVKRTESSKEATIEAHGLVDGQPTSKHFSHLHYDDVVTLESVTSPEMIHKTTSSFEMSSNLGSEGGTRAIVGTIYHFGDTYRQLIKRGAVKTRIYPCTKDGQERFTVDNCVLQAPAYLKKKRRDQGAYTFGTQMLLNPRGDSAMTFNPDWIRWITNELTPDEAGDMFRVLLVDPANEKRKTNDWSAFWVFGLDGNRNYICLDHVRDRLNLAERTRVLFELHEIWKPQFVGYEKYGKDADIQHIQAEMEHLNYRFDIHEMGGTTPKLDRIKRLQPVFEQGRIWLRRARHYTNYEGETSNLIDRFVEEEYKAFPVMEFDDCFDCMARLEDPEVQKYLTWPNATRRARPEVVTQTRGRNLPQRPGMRGTPQVITRR